MKQLEKEFTSKGDAFRQVAKNDFGYIYSITFEGKKEVNHYEIFEHKENTRFDCVSYPTENAFGIWAFSTHNYYRAFDILESFKI